jgi:hypothetical protein
MQIIKSFRVTLLFLLPLSVFAQTNYLQPGLKDQIFLDRLEIKSANPNLNYSTVKPYPRKQIVKAVENIDSLIAANDSNAPSLSAVDKYNMEHFLMNNTDWSTPRESYLSKRPALFNTFYKTKGNAIEVNNKELFLVVNPLLYLEYGKERGNSESNFINSRGVAVRGMIDRRVGFNVYFTENQERDPIYVQQWIAAHKAVPGEGYYKDFKKNGVDYFDIRGSISWNVAKYIDMQFGYDKNSIGAGYRSLFLSDFSNSGTFFKINTRIWKFNYENLYMELMPQFTRVNQLRDRKYFRMNHLSINPTKWLNVGLFDAVMFGRENHFDFQYLLPVMFLRPAEQQIGSPDNAVLGLDAKVNIKKTVQVYTQILFDEFKLSELKKNRGWWANKYGYQLGVKYIDALGIKNLDVQLETNCVTPFTYSHFDSVANYTHYNQPLAHPLGANFQEFIVIGKFQPLPKLYLQAKLIHYNQGTDTANANFGSNPLKNYNTRTMDYGNFVGTGNKATCNNLFLQASYELKENLFVDGTIQARSYKLAKGADQNTTIVSLGIRWNMARRDFDF